MKKNKVSKQLRKIATREAIEKKRSSKSSDHFFDVVMDKRQYTYKHNQKQNQNEEYDYEENYEENYEDFY